MEVRATKVSGPVGKVKVPPLVIVDITGLVNVLFVNVSLEVRATKVSGPVGRVKVPPLVIVDITGLVNVLLLTTADELAVKIVLGPVGKVRTPPLVIELITGIVSVLPTKVCVVFRVHTVSEVVFGNVNTLLAPDVKFKLVVVPLVVPAKENANFLVGSIL